MRKIVVFFLSLFVSINLLSIDLIKVLEIGDDSKEEYTFFSIGDITTDNNENIYVFDSKGFVLRKYDKNGKFIKQVGGRGQGPGDFSFSSSLSFYKNKLFVHDSGNSRIGIYDTNLNLLDYIKLKPGIPISCGNFDVFENHFYFNLTLGNQRAKIIITDIKTNIVKRAFNLYPEYLKNVLNIKDIKRKVFLDIYSSVIFNINREKKEIAVMFQYPESIPKLYILDLKGNLKIKYNLSLYKDYEIPEYMKKITLKIGKERRYSIIKLLYLKNYVFISYFEYGGKKIRGIPYFAVYDVNNKKLLKNEKGLFYILYHSSGDKIYLSNEDNDKVLVFKIK